MKTFVEYAVLGLYVPIVVFSSLGSILFLTRLLWPAAKAHKLDLEHYAIGISATAALSAHALENGFYGMIRWNTSLRHLNDSLPVVGLWKVLILVSAIFAVAALSKAATDSAHIKRLFGIAAGLWAAGTLAAWIFT